MLIQVALISVFLLLLVRIFRQRTMGKIFRGASAGLILLACYVVAFPNVTNGVAAIAGVGRGADLIIYLCMATGAYLLTTLYIRLRKNELNTAKLVQRHALDARRIEELEFEAHRKAPELAP